MCEHPPRAAGRVRRTPDVYHRIGARRKGQGGVAGILLFSGFERALSSGDRSGRWRRSPIIRDIAHRPFLRAPRTLARALGVRHRHTLAHGHMAPHYDTPKGLARATVAYDGDTQYSAASPRLSALPSLPPPFVPFATPSATSSAASPAAAAAHALGHRLLARAPNSAASATPPMLML